MAYGVALEVILEVVALWMCLCMCNSAHISEDPTFDG